MDEQNMAANAGTQDVSVSESPASSPETPATETVPQGQATQPTETQAFARRLKEETEKVRQTERDALIAEMYGESHGIRTYADYQKAVEAQKRQAEIDRLVQQNIPKEYAEKLMKVDEIERQLQQEQQTKAQREQQQKQYTEFLEAYPDIKPDQIPAEVWQTVKQGISLLDAYVRYENKNLKGELSKYQQQQQTQQANQANAASSTGSVKGQGLPDSGYISKEVYDQNKGNQSWMMKNYDNIKKSMTKWGK